MKNFSVLLVARSPKFGELISSMISRSFKESFVRLVNDPEMAMKFLEKFSYQIVISDLDFKHANLNGVAILLKAKNQRTGVKTILMFRDFSKDCPDDELDDLELLGAVDCFWKKLVGLERLKMTIGKLLQSNDKFAVINTVRIKRQ
jgi:two-component SAPR family response regulator